MRPTPRSTPDDWARANRVYGPSTGVPGPRDPSRTPYMIPFARAFDIADQLATYGQRYDSVVLATSSQTGKTDTVLDIMGWTLDQRPAPMLYVGPNKDFLNREISPRLREMLLGCTRLNERLAKGKRETAFRKVVGGVPVVLGWAGSAASLAAMAAKFALIDEYDRMDASIQGEGDPYALLEARGYSFRDRLRAAISTPLTGTVDVERDERSGLEFWRRMDQEDVQSPIWRLWQNGTMHHWCWPCPHCADFFVPRFKQLRWPEAATEAEAKRSAYLECPHCGGVIEERHKREMNERGVYVAPGQSVAADGTLSGKPPESTTLSFWASGLCSPFVTFGERAASYLAKKASGNEAEIQVAMNTGFGECYAPGGGDVPEWEEVRELARPYAKLEIPAGVRMLTLAVDVQMRSLYYTIDGWSAAGTRWTIDYGELLGATTEKKVWDDLGQILKRPIGGMAIRRCFIDSGFRPGKPINLPINRVYEFCRVYPNLVFPTKGQLTQEKPLKFAKIEVNALGKTKKYGLDLVHIHTDWAKSSVHERIRKDADQPGAWCLPQDVTEGFCKQIVSEARVRKPSGAPIWVRRSRDNHYLDCEALQEAIGFSLNAHLIEVAVHNAPASEGLPVRTLPKAGVRPPPQSTPRPAPDTPAAVTIPPPVADRETAKADRRKRIAELSARLYGR